MSTIRCLVISVTIPITYWILTIAGFLLILCSTNHLKRILKDLVYPVINGADFYPLKHAGKYANKGALIFKVTTLSLTFLEFFLCNFDQV